MTFSHAGRDLEDGKQVSNLEVPTFTWGHCRGLALPDSGGGSHKLAPGHSVTRDITAPPSPTQLSDAVSLKRPTDPNSNNGKS